MTVTRPCWGSKKAGLISLPVVPESTSIISQYVTNMKPVPQVEAPGQVDGPFSQADLR